ncbi:MAG TPA: 3-hydroxyacyl-CoA dehydrogenase NAD-binding domain-containing protein, partial [Candidatus Saccharimonadales bacterium]|nr:3-hydroxyacyl-CoA dehydrogenase NAD-binding domain-containing protein [Candidatus Saccharimonadales bacterium]
EVAVLGAGVMGASIAGLAASKGFGVRLREIAPAPLEKGVARARKVISGGRKKRRPASWVAERSLKVRPALTLAGFTRMDLVIEAIVEDLGIKQTTLREMEERVSERCVLATNTSSIPVDRIASALRRPEGLVGLHFFNPADRMPLVEVVRGARSAPEAVATAVAFARKLGKTPVVTGDAPGFVVNRLLMPYLSEAMQVLIDGAGPEQVDRDLKRFGMPMGPLALLDQVGIDVAAHVAKVLEEAFPPPGASPEGTVPRRLLEAMAAEGWLGAKSGRGFYVHQGKAHHPHDAATAKARALAAAGRPRSSMAGETLVARLLYPIVNEAARVIAEGVADGPAAVDVAMVLGTGFPPFLGGPLRWADRVGLEEIVRTLDDLAETHGAHLAPSEPLAALAKGTGRFHAD